MNNKIEIKKGFLGCDTLTKEDLILGVNIDVYSCTHDLLVYNQRNEKMEGTIFGLIIEPIKCPENEIFLDLPMDELEMFAHSILKHIEIVKTKHADDIKKQISLGNMDY